MQSNHVLGNSYRSFYDTSLKHDSMTLHLHTITLLTHLICETFALSMVLSSFPRSLIPPSIFSSFPLLTTKCSLSFEISNAAILWGTCTWEDRTGYMICFTKFLVKPVSTLMVSAERARNSHLSLGHPWHPQVAPIQGWQEDQGEQAWHASWCCSGSLAGQEFFLAKSERILFTVAYPCRWTLRENKHQETQQNWDTQGQTEGPEAEEGKEEVLTSPSFSSHPDLLISLFPVPCNYQRCHQWAW